MHFFQNIIFESGGHDKYGLLNLKFESNTFNNIPHRFTETFFLSLLFFLKL